MALPKYRIEHPLWMVFGNMMLRCGYFKGEPERLLRRYRDRGITVCPEWRTFPPFEKWALEHGYKSGLELDRINNNGNYCPENCRFVTHKENARNREATIMVERNGQPVPLITLYEESGSPVSYDCMRRRYKRGMPLEDCLSRPNKVPNRPFLAAWNKQIGTVAEKKIRDLFIYDTHFAEEHGTPVGEDKVFDALWMYAARDHYMLREMCNRMAEIVRKLRSCKWVSDTTPPTTAEGAVERHNAELDSLIADIQDSATTTRETESSTLK